MQDVALHEPALVLGTGKAAAAMAVAFDGIWVGPRRGVVVTRYGHGLSPSQGAGPIEVLEAGHPLPDEASMSAGSLLLKMAADMRADETLWFLASGGGSALSVAPLPRLALEDKRSAADWLIRSGATIGEINCVRKHLSALKGGRVARLAHPARVVTLAISDVPGDALSDIASGPTVPDPTTQHEARRILQRYGYERLGELTPVLSDPRFETPKPGDDDFAADEVRVIASAATALDAAQAHLEKRGFTVHRLGDDLQRDARRLGREHARLARSRLAGHTPCALLSGGETRVVLGQSHGRGGRNLEYLAALALELDGCPGIWALAADTDGLDGAGDHAGGIVVPEILKIGRRQGMKLETFLAAHDTYAYFERCGLLLKTGPTRTNVNDFRLILCEPGIETGSNSQGDRSGGEERR